MASLMSWSIYPVFCRKKLYILWFNKNKIPCLMYQAILNFSEILAVELLIWESKYIFNITQALQLKYTTRFKTTLLSSSGEAQSTVLLKCCVVYFNSVTVDRVQNHVNDVLSVTPLSKINMVQYTLVLLNIRSES
jgi:hypothetical protein